MVGFLSLVSAAAAAGCSSSSAPVVASDASTPAADSSAPAADAAQGGEDAGASDAADAGAMGPAAFVGTWARSGTYEQTCPGNNIETVPVTGNLVIAPGTPPSAVVGTQPDGCSVTFTVSGNVATAAAGQPCTIVTDGGVTFLTTTLTHTLTVSGDGTTLTEASSLDVALTLVDGGAESCTATTAGSFAKQ